MMQGQWPRDQLPRPQEQLVGQGPCGPLGSRATPHRTSEIGRFKNKVRSPNSTIQNPESSGHGNSVAQTLAETPQVSEVPKACDLFQNVLSRCIVRVLVLWCWLVPPSHAPFAVANF